MNVESTLTVIAAAAAVVGWSEPAVPSCSPIRSRVRGATRPADGQNGRLNLSTRRGALQMGVTVPSDLTHEAAELLKALAWPISVLLSLTMLRHPISDFLRDISKRVTKLSIFKVEIELAKLNALRALPGPLLSPLQKGVFRPDAPTVDANANILNMETMPIVTTGIIRASMADYVIIDVGDGDEWLTSRLYLLAALLERSLVRAIVFATKGDFVGNPHHVRSMLGIAFTEYERARLWRRRGPAYV
jgi:hypothetical protein